MPRSLMHGHVLVALRAEVLTHRCPSAPIVQQQDIYLFKQTVFPLSSTLSVSLCFVSPPLTFFAEAALSPLGRPLPISASCCCENN